MRTLLAFTTMLALSLAAHADSNKGNENDNKNDNRNTLTTTNVNANSATATGGAGGRADADARASNFNVNNAEGGNASVKNSGNSLSVNVNDNDTTVSNRQRQSQSQSQSQQQVQTTSSYSKSKVEDSGNSSNNITIEGDQYRRQTPSAYGVALTVGNEVCAQSQTAGGSSPVFGFTLGITHDNEGCNMRRNASTIFFIGQALKDERVMRASIGIMCADDDVKEALVKAGVSCDGTTVSAPGEHVADLSPAYVPMAPVKD